MAKAWLAGWNRPGFLPDAEPADYETWSGARDALVFELERIDCDTPADEADADAAMVFLNGAAPGMPCTTAPVMGYVYWIAEADD